MKYNVGDKVLDKSDLEFLFNPFWKEKYRKNLLKTVTEADDKYFTIYKPNRDRYNSAIEEGLSCGANEYMVFYQSSGRTRNWASNTTLLHAEKDKDFIINFIKELGEKTFIKNDTSLENEIKRRERDRVELKETYGKDLIENLKIFGEVPLL
jgi:hypothetical protein